ncbi:MAG: GNAT family N-acetyltransferase [Clostridia bacterium]|nr:GNAT family N-acetyltransferase [Clostridia bacterium]
MAWNTYLEFEAPDYEPQGIDTFKRDIMDNAQFKESCCNGTNRMWGAYDREKLVGIFIMREASHICLAFTHRDYHRRGIATAIFNQLLKDVRIENPEVKKITLNSSPYGRPFFHRVGFVDTDTEKTIDGIRFTPMEYKL